MIIEHRLLNFCFPRRRSVSAQNKYLHSFSCCSFYVCCFLRPRKEEALKMNLLRCLVQFYFHPPLPPTPPLSFRYIDLFRVYFSNWLLVESNVSWKTTRNKRTLNERKQTSLACSFQMQNVCSSVFRQFKIRCVGLW